MIHTGIAAERQLCHPPPLSEATLRAAAGPQQLHCDDEVYLLEAPPQDGDEPLEAQVAADSIRVSNSHHYIFIPLHPFLTC